MASFDASYARARRGRMWARLASLALLVLAIVLDVVLPVGVFPPGAVLLSALVAAALLPPVDAFVVAVIDLATGVALAHYVSEYSGSALVYRSGFYALGCALAVVLAVIRTRREREIEKYEFLEALHTMSAALTDVETVEEVGSLAVVHAQRLLSASGVRLWIVAGNQELRVAGDVGAQSGSRREETVLPLTGGTASAEAVMHDRASFFADRAAYERTYPGMVSVLTEFRVASIAVVPTRSDRRSMGALVIAYSKRVAFDSARRVAIEHVADAVGVAIERVTSRERERAAAVRLQESLLGPPVLVEGIGHAARYLPAEAALHVGGDWYLAQPLPDGRIAVSIGDVVGRGLEAATVMGQLRSALSAFASRSTNSAVTLDFLDDFARTIPGATSTTVVLARVDLWGHTVEYSSAGHPPPLLVSPDGEPVFLDNAQSCPLAVVPNVRQRPTATAEFPPGSLLLLYSDGLIERRAQSLDEGMARLESAVRMYWNLPLDLLCNALVDDLLDAPRADDVAILAVRSPVLSAHMLLKKERASPSALAPLRSAMREWLGRQELPADHIDAMLIAAGEATSNAIEHAYADAEPGLLRLEATVSDGQVVCCVTDTGTWKEQGQRAGRGNGITVMRDLVDDVTIVRSPRGTSVCLRIARRARVETA